MSRPEKIYGCKLTALSEEECRNVVNWAGGEAKPHGMANGFVWLLAHLADGVTWGMLDGNGQWALGSTAFPDLCPTIREDNLLELRLFGQEAEILVWSHDDGFSGRLLRDDPAGGQEPCVEPYYEALILLGDRLIEKPKDGFSRVGTGDGREQAVPLECSQEDFYNGRWPLRLRVRHYFKRDENTGTVHVAATRLVDVYNDIRNKEPRR